MEGRHCEDLLKAEFVRDLGELSFVGKEEPVTPFIAHISVTEEPATRGQNRCRDEMRPVFLQKTLQESLHLLSISLNILLNTSRKEYTIR